jgi:hypothetical protein
MSTSKIRINKTLINEVYEIQVFAFAPNQWSQHLIPCIFSIITSDFSNIVFPIYQFLRFKS